MIVVRLSEQHAPLIDPFAIDALLAEKKALAGAPRWIGDERGAVASLAAPVAKRGVVGALSFRATALVYEPIQSGSCVLVFDGRPIQRLSFRPTHAHVNPFGPSVSTPLRGLHLPAGKSRVYLWAENRAWPRPKGDNVGVAQPILLDMEGLDKVLAIFLQMCNVDGVLPPAPWEPRLL